MNDIFRYRLIPVHHFVITTIYIYTKYFLENNKTIINFITIHIQIDMKIDVIGNCELKT